MYQNSYSDNPIMNEDESIFSEYTVDDSLDSLSRLKKYCTSDFYLQRKILVAELYDTCLDVGYEKSVTDILPLIANFISDTETIVRKTLAEQLYPLSIYFYENATNEKIGYTDLINTFIPFTFELIIDKKMDVSETATKSLVRIASLIKTEHVSSQLFEVIKSLARIEKVEVYRIAGAKLFNLLAPKFGERLCILKVIDEIIKLSKDSSLSVRKTVASNLNKISEIIGVDMVVEKIFPIYNVLCQDEIWGVRKACVESLPSMSKHVNKHVRVNALTKCFEDFTDDVSRWVKIEAYRQLGPFISTFQPDEIHENLVQYFTDMAFQGDQSDSDLVEFCAFYFPAVVKTIGREKWNLVERAYKCLIKDVQWKVRKSLASSLHEIAVLVGTEITQTVLCNAFHVFIKDLDDVKIGVVANISKFLSVISKEKRNDFLDMITTIPEDTENWRIKHKIANQISELLKLFDDEKSRHKLLKLFLTLLCDEFAIIRKTTAAKSGEFLHHLFTIKDFENVRAFISFIIKFVNKSWVERMLYVIVCHHIINYIPPKIFTEKFLGPLLKLSDDKVNNVKILLARVVNNDLLQNENWKNDHEVLSCKKNLKCDDDQDVLYYANQTNVNLSTALQNTKLNELVS